MEALTNVAFAGYAYYSAAGDGFVYALRSKDSSATGSPVILVDPTAKAAHFFPCLFLVAGGTLMVGLLAFVVVAFCCQRKVAKLEETYWKLQHTFADVNDTLVREVSRRTSATAATSSASLKQRCTSKSNSQRVAGSQSPSPMPQHRGSTASMTSIRQPQHIREQPPAAPVFPATPSPYGMNPNPPYLQPMNVSPTTMHNFSYNDNCVQAALFPPQALPVPLSPSQHHTRTLGGFVAPQSTCLTPDQPLRRRASKDVQTSSRVKQMQQQQRQPVEHYLYVELISLTYSGPAPAPAPACTDPTPDEQLRQAITHKKEMLKQKEAQQRQQVAHGAGQAHNPASGTASGGGSFTKHLSVSAGEIFSNIKSSVSHAVLSLEKGATNVSTRTEEQMRQYEYQHDLDRFRLHFWELVEQGELLLGAYRCSAMHGGVQVNGHIQITRHYLCFFADTSSTITKTTDAVRDALASVRQPAGANPEGRHRPVGIKLVTPLVEIASIQPSVAHKTIDGQAPFFTLLPAATVCATALQVYTADKKLHQFLNFESLMSRASGALSELKTSPLDQTYNYLDHAWRELVTVPLKGVEYA